MDLIQFIDQHPDHFPHNNEHLKAIMQSIVKTAVKVSAEVRKAGLNRHILGAQGSENVQGEAQQKLDVYADDLFMDAFRNNPVIAAVASEENEDFVAFDPVKKAEYVLMMDPLDGSSNIDVNVSIGTIFSVCRRVSPVDGNAVLEDFLQPGRKQVLAGYVLYGTSTMLVFTSGSGVNGFTLDPEKETFYLSHAGIKTPEEGKVYAINEVNYDDFGPSLKRFVQYCRDRRKPNGNRMYTGRYIGSLVADFHRNMLKGGIYVYPATVEAPSGKLRLLYECNPIAFVQEQAGGKATNGQEKTLDIIPDRLHERCPFYVGSMGMMQEAM